MPFYMEITLQTWSNGSGDGLSLRQVGLLPLLISFSSWFGAVD